jgi:cysteine-rich repeat protein
MPASIMAMRTLMTLLTGWLVIGCVQSQSIPCGDLLCPSGSVCTEAGQCAFPLDIEACLGRADGDTCESRRGAGICSTGVCTVSQCGNGRVDSDEACDDGNRVGADGCAANCSKNEVCGDAVIDEGEACDDGNLNAVDGCDACTLTQWSASAIVGGQLLGVSIGLAHPGGTAVDVAGNLYFADTDNHRIRRVDRHGNITTVAGAGTFGYSGDNNTATSAQLANPKGVAVDGLGNIYIADTGNDCIRRVDRIGIITTVAGTGELGYAGDGGDARQAQLSSPFGVAVDGFGNLYIADTGNHRIRQIDDSGIIRTIAGAGTQGYTGDASSAMSAQLAFPFGVAVDEIGNLYIADTYNHCIRRVNSSGIITTVAGVGGAGYNNDNVPAINARLAYPFSVAADGQGNLYIGDTYNHRIRRVDNAGTITTVAGTGTFSYSGDQGEAISADVAHPSGVVLDAVGNLYIADTDNNRIRRVDNTGIITTVAGTGTRGYVGDNGPATSAELTFPNSMAMDNIGNLYVADTDNHRIRRIDGNGVITTVVGTGTFGYAGDDGPANGAELDNPYSVVVDGRGNLFIADAFNHRIRKVDGNGIITTVAGTGDFSYGGDNGPAISAQLAVPKSVAVDSLGNLFIADTSNHRVRRVDTRGIITTVAGTGTLGARGDNRAATQAQLNYPTGVAVDGLGNLYIADTDNHRIRRVDSNGIITTVAGNGTLGYFGDNGAATNAQLASPSGVAVDSADNLYIADTDNHRIRRVSSNGVITTVAGNGVFGYSGDLGAAVGATTELAKPFSVIVHGSDLLIADRYNHRIRRVDSNGIIDTVAGGAQLAGAAGTTRIENLAALSPGSSGSMYFAMGASGAVARIRDGQVAQVAGRHAGDMSAATGNLAGFRDRNFGSVGGVAWDDAAQLLYLTESSAQSSRVWAVTPVDLNNPNTWSIAPLVNDAGTAGFADGAAGVARLRNPTGLWIDTATRTLYIVDTGNHAIRALDLTTRLIATVVNTSHSLGFAGDGGAAGNALLFQPQALTKCANGDLFIADTGNNRIRRIAANTGLISTVVGDGVATSSGQGAPATIFSVDKPMGVACDAANNLFVSSSTTVRLLPASPVGIVDGAGEAQTIYGAAPRNAFPASETSCLTGMIAPTATTLQVTDSCSGLVVELSRSKLR